MTAALSVQGRAPGSYGWVNSQVEQTRCTGSSWLWPTLSSQLTSMPNNWKTKARCKPTEMMMNTTDLFHALTCWLLNVMNGLGYRFCAMAPVGEPTCLSSNVGQKCHSPLLFSQTWVSEKCCCTERLLFKLGLTLAVSLHYANSQSTGTRG